MADSRENSAAGLIALVISLFGFLGFLGYLIWAKNQRDYKATTTTEYDSEGRPTKITEDVKHR